MHAPQLRPKGPPAGADMETGAVAGGPHRPAPDAPPARSRLAWLAIVALALLLAAVDVAARSGLAPPAGDRDPFLPAAHPALAGVLEQSQMRRSMRWDGYGRARQAELAAAAARSRNGQPGGGIAPDGRQPNPGTSAHADEDNVAAGDAADFQSAEDPTTAAWTDADGPDPTSEPGVRVSHLVASARPSGRYKDYVEDEELFFISENDAADAADKPQGASSRLAALLSRLVKSADAPLAGTPRSRPAPKPDHDV
ncbi:hypothetical protein DFJ74DRAFT_670844 [Hyaloraphidium curvatum]|nr:hypothetical protein DFJ74DRAFT_670844 [Hyaloraphidium curvatum]